MCSSHAYVEVNGLAKEENGMKIVIDGTELPYSGIAALAAALYHRMSGDKVVYRKKRTLIEVHTLSRNSVSLTPEYASAVAGNPYKKWHEVTQKILGRPFDPSLDLACYKDKPYCERKAEFDMAKKGRNPTDRPLRKYFYTIERIMLTHIGDCSLHSTTPHVHDLEIDVDGYLLCGLEYKSSFNLDSFREGLVSLSQKLIVGTGGTVAIDRLVGPLKNCFGESEVLVIPAESKWHETIANMIITHLQVQMNGEFEGNIKLREDGSLLAMTELKGDE